LKRFFGVEVAVHRGPGTSIRARWVDNRHEDEPATLEQVFSQCQYALGHDQTSSGKKSGVIRIGCNFKHVGGPTLEEVEDVFGNEWRNGWLSSPPPLHGVPARPTAPNGNARMIYNFDKESLRRSVEVTFDPNAEFSSFTLEEEER